jgi:hypothetical protein
MSRRTVQALVVVSTIFTASALTFGCSQPAKPAPASGTVAAATPPQLPAPKLWGDMKPIVSVKELMRDFIDPASDYVFDSVATIITKGKRVDREPRTDEEWDRVRWGGTMLAEGVYLLKIPRPFAPAGDVNNSTGPDPEELSPTQITAKLEKDPVLWNAKIEALRNVGLEVLDIVKRRNAKELWDASDNLDQACEGCHLAYWYPGEGEFLKKLDKHLEDLYGIRADRSRKLGMDPK